MFLRHFLCACVLCYVTNTQEILSSNVPAVGHPRIRGLLSLAASIEAMRNDASRLAPTLIAQRNMFHGDGLLPRPFSMVRYDTLHNDRDIDNGVQWPFHERSEVSGLPGLLKLTQKSRKSQRLQTRNEFPGEGSDGPKRDNDRPKSEVFLKNNEIPNAYEHTGPSRFLTSEKPSSPNPEDPNEMPVIQLLPPPNDSFQFQTFLDDSSQLPEAQRDEIFISEPTSIKRKDKCEAGSKKCVPLYLLAGAMGR